jgi:iron complex outermembrane recepter protein
MKLNKSIILAGTALASLVTTTGAFAQSTATQQVEEKTTEVVIRGARSTGAIRRESGPKAKATIGQETISKAAAGQTIADTLNQLPGYNFTNNDAYGSSGGNVMMRGLDGSRVSLTFDGMQLNDSGNYAIYTNQQMEPELICSASVQGGATDVDSMTASATGGTINYTTCKPEEAFGGVVKLSGGSDNFQNLYVRLDSGTFGPFGTSAFFAYTGQTYDTWTREPNLDPDINAHLQKNQYNARIYQPVGDEGSFMSLAFHWNENRNHFQFGPSNPQRYCMTQTTNDVGGAAGNVFPTCGYDYNSINGGNINPSNTGNIRGQSKWVLSDKLTLTVDPQFQYVLANGGGNSTLSETSAQLRGSKFSTVAGVDLNGDGDFGDTVTIYRPNTTNTHRYGLNTNLIYALTETQTLRVGYSADRARHRQTGEATLVDVNNAPLDVFGGRENHDLRIKTADGDGSYWRRRDRLSFANVDVLSFEYRGRFFDEKLLVDAGIRQQKMERDLNQNCYSPLNGTGSTAPYCSTQKVLNSYTMADGNKVVILEGSTGNNTVYFAPYTRSVSFDKTLPNLGLTWSFNPSHQIFGTYAESMSSPRTDSYYAVVLNNAPTSPATLTTVSNSSNFTANKAFFEANSLNVANPVPETSQTIEFGYRFRKPTFQANATVFASEDHNRIVSSYDYVSDTFFDRNVGDVKRQGFEGSAAYNPVENLVLNASITYKSDIVFGENATGIRYLPTKGKALVEMPKWMGSFGVDYAITPDLALTLNAKYVGDRFTTDVNDDVAEHFVVWNAQVRYDLPFLKEGTYLQLNAINLFDQQYVGSVSSQNNAYNLVDNTGASKSGTKPFLNVGAPRTIVLSLRAAF